MKAFPALVPVLLIAGVLAGCQSRPHVVVLGAASVTNAVDEIRQQFAEQGGAPVSTSYMASSVLAQQIESGAEADVFISANVKWADYLQDQGLVARRRDLLGNRLVIVVRKGSTVEIHKPEDLLVDDVRGIALAETEAVPAGIYAKQALTTLGLWQRLKGKLVTGDDVRQALVYVETGAAEAGIVYATDAAVSTEVKVAVELPADLTDPIRYPVMLLEHGRGNPEAEAFFEYLCSPEAAKVFTKYGFTVQTETKDK